jgi:hypothetical protein
MLSERDGIPDLCLSCASTMLGSQAPFLSIEEPASAAAVGAAVAAAPPAPAEAEHPAPVVAAVAADPAEVPAPGTDEAEAPVNDDGVTVAESTTPADFWLAT